jgi:hypothetical protein
MAHRLSCYEGATHLRHFFFAARDYVKISRASTDATGASLTIFGRNVLEDYFRWWGTRKGISPTTKSQSQLRQNGLAAYNRNI